MSDLTALDAAHAAMEADEANAAARLRFYERLADSELFLLLSEEPVDENVSPELFELSDHAFVLVFDREDRLAQFVGRPAPYAALSGRVIAGLLDGQGIGLGVNLEVAPSSILIPPEAVTWLSETLGHAPDEAEARIEEIGRPAGLPEALLEALDSKLVTATGLAHSAYLAAATYEGGARNHLLAFVDAVPGAEDALAKAVSEALTFSGIEAGALDVSFVRASDPLAAKLAQWGLRFDLPQPEEVQELGRAAPGSDPDKPPILR
ncbi:SseB family protein [Thalassovita mangrovi]|uniref:SseB family protein n=1 Tax=Thalassovita mangrovi TaxID=2692236 RepID=A0A6L8LLS4_9RHOB|nr:SseB family protein [Thalassovita mangrovi]MYM56991.1 SseB family protein [Thalassovita mangrovi]